jgi:hypothetical protein
MNFLAASSARRLILIFWAGAAMLMLSRTFNTYGQSAPMVLSLTPTNGATAVATNSSIVIVFDQDMKTAVFPFETIGGFIGNFALQPTNIFASGSWAADKRTLTLKPSQSFPYETNVIWTLNPTGTTSLPRFSSASGQLLATVSGSFTTQAPPPPPPPPPALLSVTPTNGAVGVAPDSRLVFVFDQEMDTSVPIVTSPPSVNGNVQFNIATLSFEGSWGADKRTLTLQSSNLLALNSPISWTLNPSGTPARLKSALGQDLPLTYGNFRIIDNTGGLPGADCQVTNTTMGYLAFRKMLSQMRQVSAGTFLSVPEGAGSFVVFAKSPPQDKGFENLPVTNGSLTLPNGTQIGFTNETFVVVTNRAGQIVTNYYGNFGLYHTNLTDTALESFYPPGDYTVRIAQNGLPQNVIPISLPTTPERAPAIANYDEAQAINSSQNFTLRWNALATQSSNAFIHLRITDQFGKGIFQAPNACLQQPLAPDATSVVIPQNILKPGLTYVGTLEFGYDFYSSSNAVTMMLGDGTVLRSTKFEMRAAGSTGAVEPPLAAIFSDAKLTNGVPHFAVQGSPGKTYSIRRTETLSNPVWSVLNTLMMDNFGKGIFEDRDRVRPPVVFYQAVAE